MRFGSVAAVALSASVGLFGGCASFASLKTARAIDPGTSEYTFSAGAVMASVPANDGSGTTQIQAEPQFEIAGRWGVAPGLDFGAKVWWPGIEVNSTISLVRGRVFDLALAPAIGLNAFNYGTSCDAFGNCDDSTDVLELYGKVPLLFGLRFGPAGEHEFVFGPEVVPITVLTGDENTGDGSSQTGLLAGGVIGVSLKLSPFLRVMPEVTVLVPAVHFSGGTDQVIDNYGNAGGVFYQAALGFSWGNDGLGHPRYSPPPRYYAPPGYYEGPPPGYYPPPPRYQQAPPPPPYRGDD